MSRRQSRSRNTISNKAPSPHQGDGNFPFQRPPQASSPTLLDDAFGMFMESGGPLIGASK